MDYKNVIKEIDDQIKELAEARRALASLNTRGSRKGTRKMTAAGRRRIAAAQRKRWAKVRATKK